METDSITVMSFLLFRILRKVMDENENDWDDFLHGTLFTFNTKVSSTTKFSPFRIWCLVINTATIRAWTIYAEGRKWWGEYALQDYMDKMAMTRNVLFSKVKHTMTTAQGK